MEIVAPHADNFVPTARVPPIVYHAQMDSDQSLVQELTVLLVQVVVRRAHNQHALLASKTLGFRQDYATALKCSAVKKSIVMRVNI